jgi:hypothetical protein
VSVVLREKSHRERSLISDMTVIQDGCGAGGAAAVTDLQRRVHEYTTSDVITANTCDGANGSQPLRAL